MLETFRRTTHLPYTKKIPCAFCHGTGKDPFGQLYPVSTCQDCHGRIEIYILTPFKTCTYYPGTGLAFSTQNTSTSCRGRGVISLGNEAPRSKAPRYLCEILRSPSTLLRQGYGGFSSPSSSQQAARYSAKENKKLDGIPGQICTGNGMGAVTNLPGIPCSGLGRR